MNILKNILVVEKSMREILYDSLISKFKHIFIELFFINCKKKNKKKKLRKRINEGQRENKNMNQLIFKCSVFKKIGLVKKKGLRHMSQFEGTSKEGFGYYI